MARDIERAYPPHVLRAYSLLAYGERGALVGPRGDIAWMCAPRWHDSALFASLIGAESPYAVTPSDPRYVWGGRYEDGTLIWRSRWVTSTGVIECRNALAFPGEPSKAVILRRIHAASGAARASAILAPGADFGSHGLAALKQERGLWSARSGPPHLRWSGAGSARAVGRKRLELEIEVAEGGTSRPCSRGV